jgi:hypothetical protein
MFNKSKYFFLFILLTVLVVPTETQPFFRSFVTKSTNVFKYGMRGWVGLALCGTFGHYVMRCEHVKEMTDAPSIVSNFVRNELLKAGMDNPESIPVKVDTDQCLLYSPSTPDSEYDSCGHSLFICHAFIVNKLEELLEKEINGTLSEAEEEKLNRHRYFIRHQGRVIINKDHERILASRFILPALALLSSHLLRSGADQVLQKTKIESVLNSNFLTFTAKKAGTLFLTIGYELAITLSLLKWYYQRRQRIADKQLDPSHTQREILEAGIKHLEKLAAQKSSRTNLSDFFVFENSGDYKRQADNLQEQLASYV